MTEDEKIIFLINELKKEMPEYSDLAVPDNINERWALLRGLFNVRPAKEASKKFIEIQDELLKEIAVKKGITDVNRLEASKNDSRICLWQGDITSLKAEAVVNAANNQMEGCFRVGHNCVDNAFHTFAGVQMRLECHLRMEELKHRYGPNYTYPTAVPMVTGAYNLPSKYVIHIVGPIAYPSLTKEHENQLAQCYRASLEAADKINCKSIGFVCISTGIFIFPRDKAAEIAVNTVKEWLDNNRGSSIKRVVFNVYKDEDKKIYGEILN